MCRRCAWSNGLSRTSRCLPRSALRIPYAFSPPTVNVADLSPASSPGLASSSSTAKPRFAAQRSYIRSIISAQSCASVPPVPDCSVTTASPASYSPSKSAASCSRSSSRAERHERGRDLARRARRRPSTRARVRRRTRASACGSPRAARDSRACSADTSAARSWSSQKPGRSSPARALASAVRATRGQRYSRTQSSWAPSSSSCSVSDLASSVIARGS